MPRWKSLHDCLQDILLNEYLWANQNKKYKHLLITCIILEATQEMLAIYFFLSLIYAASRSIWVKIYWHDI